MALLEDDDGGRYSVLQQLDRIGVQDADSPKSAEPRSLWQFRDVMRGSLHVISDVEPRRDWQSVQRVALGLSGAEQEVAGESAANINVGANRLRVMALREEPESALTAVSPCPMHFLMTMPDVLRLEFTQGACGESNGSGPLRVVTSDSLVVEGKLNGSKQVRGTGWLRHAFGDLPTAGSPIVFDTALVDIDAKGLLMLSISKRRSGRGPETLSAHWHGEPSAMIDDLTWRKLDIDDESGAASRSWQLQSASNQLDVTLVSVAGDSWVNGPAGAAWRGAVIVNGTHTGVGFVEVQPVAGSDSGE